MPLPAGKLRQTEVFASLSLAMDLGLGQPLGHGLSTTLLAVGLAEELGCDRETVRSVHNVSLLRFLGCTADAAETAQLAGGDDIGFNGTMSPVVFGGTVEAVRSLGWAVGHGSRLPRKARLLAGALADPGAGARSLRTHCEVATMLARRLDVEPSVLTALGHAYERWDGKGPNGLEEAAVPLEIRIATVARDADMFRRRGEDVTAILSSRRGGAYDPAVVDALAAVEPVEDETWEAVLAAEPGPVAYVGDLSRLLTAMADFVDLKSPWTRGHSPRVADLARAAAVQARLSERAPELEAAGLVHDLGRIGIENGVWDKPGPLSAGEWEKVRMHPYLTHRILGRCQTLEPLGMLAASHHERLDGSGYHRSATDADLNEASRLLAAADSYAALTSPRPHRLALSPDEAADVLEEEAAAGRLDRRAVTCVLAAARGETRPSSAENPGGLTDREVEVLRLVAGGMTNRQAGVELFISPKTVGRHVENIYAKIGVTSRAAAAVFAMENRLLG